MKKSILWMSIGLVAVFFTATACDLFGGTTTTSEGQTTTTTTVAPPQYFHDAGVHYGFEVAMSADGTVSAAADYYWTDIYTSSGGSWTKAKTISIHSRSLSISADGSTVVGCYDHDHDYEGVSNDASAISIITTGSGNWDVDQTLSFTDFDICSVEISDDGSTLFAGDAYSNALFVFTNTGSAFVEATNYLGFFSGGRASLACNYDGSKFASALVDYDVLSDGSDYGMILVFEDMVQTGVIYGDTPGGIGFGFSMDMTSNGMGLLIGAPHATNTNNTGYGSAYYLYITNETDSFYNGNGARDVFYPGNHSNMGDEFGHEVLICGEGDTLFVSAPMGAGLSGAVIRYQKVDGVWNQGTSIGDTYNDGLFGWSIGAKENGRTVIIGAPYGGTTLMGFIKFNNFPY